MAKFTIIIKGIAMSYHRGDQVWKVIFPFDDCHTVNFIESENSPPIPLGGMAHGIEIKTKNAGSVFEIGDNYHDFLDLTAGYSHSGGVRPRHKWEERGLLITIENAKFSVDEYTNSRYQLEENGNVTKAPAVIGYSGRVEIDAEEIEISAPGADGFPKTYSGNATLVFDNNCYDEEFRDSSDFQMLYNVVEDKADGNRTFSVERDPVQQPPDEPAPDKEIKDTNPGPLERGLPCHKVRISQAEDMP